MGASVGAVTKQTLFPPLMPAGRPFRVSNASRSSRKGIVASSLQELLSKTLDAFVITAGIVTLVLEEDGTVVDTEEFFKSLDDNTHFMVLENGQKWTPTKNGVVAVRKKKKMGVANITFDLYKLNPKDFIGCLNIKATFYEIYSISYDIKCMGAKSVLRLQYRSLLQGILLKSVKKLSWMGKDALATKEKIIHRSCLDLICSILNDLGEKSTELVNLYDCTKIFRTVNQAIRWTEFQKYFMILIS